MQKDNLYSGVSDKSLQRRFTQLNTNIKRQTCQSFSHSYAVINKIVFNCVLSMAKEPVSETAVGRPCHKRGPCPTTGKDRSPAAVSDRSSNRRPELVDRSRRLVAADESGRMYSLM